MLKKTFLTFVFLTLLTTFYGLNANFGPYGNRTAGSFIGSAERTEIAHTISVYDELIRSVSEEEGYDWRLMSAIAYHESRFSPDIVSKRGAAGLMQIMPAVARQFNVTGDRLLDPETNVRLAAQVLSKIDAGLRFAPGTPDDDRIQRRHRPRQRRTPAGAQPRRESRFMGDRGPLSGAQSAARILRAAGGTLRPVHRRQPDEGLRPRRSETLRPLLPYRRTLRTRSRFRNRKQRGSLPRCFFIELPPAEIQYAPCGNQRPPSLLRDRAKSGKRSNGGTSGRESFRRTPTTAARRASRR